ncbi:MAG: DNA-binding protein [Nanoarchaeota archaeon]
MKIKDLQANQGKVNLTVEVISKEEPRTFAKFGKEGRVCNAKIKDDSGEVGMTLWNDEIDLVDAGQKINIQNGWCSEFKEQKQVSAGKFGKIELVENKK